MAGVTQQIVDQADVVGWRFDYQSAQSEEWRSVVLLQPDLTAAKLRRQFGEVRNVSELIALDPVIDAIDNVREEITPVGWRFETHNPVTGEWDDQVKLDGTTTETESRQRHESIRNVTPIASAMAVAQACFEHEQTDISQHVND